MNKHEKAATTEGTNSHTARTKYEGMPLVSKQQAGYHQRPSTRSLREQDERDELLVRRMIAEGHKADLLASVYGAEPKSVDGKLLAESWKARHQRDSIRHTSGGDFCHLHANRMIIK